MKTKPTKFRVNSGFGFPYFVEITPEGPKEDIVDAFTSGNCHSFALALNKLTGWQLCACYRERDDEFPAHVFVQNDEGNYVDVTGEKTPKQFARQWWGIIVPITKTQIRGWVRAWKETQCGYIPTKVAATLPYAKKLRDNNFEEDTWQR